jgi:hypothetical protein
LLLLLLLLENFQRLRSTSFKLSLLTLAYMIYLFVFPASDSLPVIPVPDADIHQRPTSPKPDESDDISGFSYSVVQMFYTCPDIYF